MNPAQSRISSNLTAHEDHQQNGGTRTIIGAWNLIFNPIPGRMENRYDQGLNRKIVIPDTVILRYTVTANDLG